MDALARSLMMVASSTPVVLRPVTCTGQFNANFDLRPDGSAGVSGGTDFTWLLRGASSAYEASYTLISGTPLAQAAGVWFSLASAFRFQRQSNPSKGTTIVEIAIRHAVSKGVVARSVITFTTTVDKLVAVVTPSSDTTEFNGSTVNSATFTCSATGGVGGYTYQWSKVSGGSIGFAAGSTSSTAIFQATGMAPGESRTATFKCAVTGSVGDAMSNTVTVTLKRPA